MKAQSRSTATEWGCTRALIFGPRALAEFDLYCERVAVAVGRLSVRIFGEETPGGERVAARSAARPTVRS
jgi:phytoene/squalene synthetase